MTDTKTTESTDLVPQKIGNYVVPKTLDAMEQLLARTKNSTIPLPFRADILPAPVQRLLYSYGGIPTHVAPNYVGILAGRPYVDADGCIDTALDQGCRLWTEPNLRVLSCLDPESGCPGKRVIKGRDGKPDKVIEATQEDCSYIASATVVKPGGGRFVDYAQCCLHTWAGGAEHRSKMARTRALRRVAKRALGLRADVRAEDDPIDVEIVEDPEDSTDGGQSPAAEPEAPKPAARLTNESSDGSEGERGTSPSDPESVVVGLLEVTPDPSKPHAVAASADEFRTKEQIAEAVALLVPLNLNSQALDPICRARFGVSIKQATRATLSELIDWLKTRELVATAQGKPVDEEPPW